VSNKLTLSQGKTEVLSGLTVALALVPEAVAFALVAHVQPLVGLYAAFFVCLITSIFGGRPGMISGATGALAVVIVALVVQHGIEYLFAAVVLMGIFQLIVGIFKLGKFIRIVPHSVMLGFVNGLAIVIFIAQLEHFRDASNGAHLTWLTGDSLYIMLGLVAVTMAIIYLLPKLTKAIPSSLFAIIAVFFIAQVFSINTLSVGDMSSIAGGLPSLHIPTIPLNWETFMIILPYSLILASVGLIETLLTLSLVDEITGTRGRNSRECMAQGAANVVTGFFGGMGGCAMIGQRMINISSGARRRLSGIVAAVSLLIFIVFAAPIIEMIPLAALVGVMFIVVLKTFAWSSFRIMHKIPLSDAVIIITVSAITVFYNLAIAVLVGVILAALTYVWKSAQHISAHVKYNRSTGTKIYHLYGAVFFGSIPSFRAIFDYKYDPQNIVVNFEHGRIWDHSGLEALDKVAEKYKDLGKNVKYIGLSPDCARLLKKAGNIVELDGEKNPLYEVVVDHSHKPGAN